MGPGKNRVTALIAAAVILISLLPRPARAAEVIPVTSAADLVSGSYILMSSEGYAPGSLDNGWLTPVQLPLEEEIPTASEEVIWTLDVSEEGVLLTDPAGNPVAPGEAEEEGLIAGEYRWQTSFDGERFFFHGISGETAVTLARCDDLGFRAYDSRLIGALYDGGFTLYRVTEEAPEEPSDPSEEATEPSEEPTEPSEEPTDPSEEPTNPTEPEEEPEIPAGPGLFFGVLHSHTEDSDGSGTPAEAYDYAINVAGLDFLAVTDHSNSLDGNENGVLSQDASGISEKWRLGKEAAAEATTGNFLALYGFEMTWQNGLGHISTFFTPGFQSRKQDAYGNYNTALESYYQTLATVPSSVSQFNHPGSFYGDFEDFGHYSSAADSVMQLMEVVCEGKADYDTYTRALDKGWHLAPTNNQNNHNGLWGSADSGRTVVYAEALTEEAFASALQNRRVYATEDADLEILYSLDSHLLGTILQRKQVGNTVKLTARISDPTDGVSGTVEVIVDGGVAAASAAAAGEVTFELPSSYRYYYLRLTQSDGDIAVTAPVWIEQRKPMWIKSFQTDTLLAVQDKPITLQVEVENPEGETVTIDRMEFFMDGQSVAVISDPGTVSAYSTNVFTADVTCAAAGAAQIQVVVTGNIQRETMICSDTLDLTFVTEDMTTTIVADGSHGTLPSLTKLEAVAARHTMELVRSEELTPELLSGCDVLLIPAPERDFEEDYTNLLGDYLASGRTLILCGQGDASAADCAERLNSLAEALGLTSRFRDDTAFDPVNNGGTGEDVYAVVTDSNRLFHQKGGCSLNPGSGTVLAMGMESTFSVDGDGDKVSVLDKTYTDHVDGQEVIRTLVTLPGEAVFLVREQTALGGTVFLSGGMFLGDDVLDPGGKNPWDEPNGNALILESILSIRRQTLPVSTIAEARKASDGATVRIRGYVTAGTAVLVNQFPGMIYVQDDTGGLGILDVTEAGISVGTPMELYLLKSPEGFRLLHSSSLAQAPYNVQPEMVGCGEGSDYDLYPEMLVKTQGKVVARTLTEDGKGVAAFTLEDKDGNRVTILVEDQIKSASTGENSLAEIVDMDNWVSAIGIQYRSGEETVLRVRNCDEIVLIREPDKVYRILKGEYTLWTRKDGKSVYMEVEGPGEEFLGIEVDGEMIDQSYYQTTEHDHLYFRIWPRYLNTLELGKHSVVFKFRDGEAKATLEIRNEADIPYTGDVAGIWLAALLLSGTALLGLRKKRTMR